MAAAVVGIGLVAVGVPVKADVVEGREFDAFGQAEDGHVLLVVAVVGEAVEAVGGEHHAEGFGLALFVCADERACGAVADGGRGAEAGAGFGVLAGVTTGNDQGEQQEEREKEAGMHESAVWVSGRAAA